MLGTVVDGRYELVRRLGEGGMGQVFEARQTFTEQRVALKLVRAELAQDPELGVRFVREARLAARVLHPGVVRVLDMGVDVDSGQLFLVTELLEGESLRARTLRAPRLSVAECVTLTRGLLDALGAAHAQGVLHRDVKPDNVMLVQGSDGAVRPVLIDFGIARALGGGDAVATRPGALLGSPAYLAPEQARGAADLDARADLWSVGALLFELLAGRPPFVGRDFASTVVAVLTEPAPPLRSLAPEAPAGLCTLVHSALERERSLRPQSAADFALALAPFDGLAHAQTPFVATGPASPAVTARAGRGTLARVLLALPVLALLALGARRALRAPHPAPSPVPVLVASPLPAPPTPPPAPIAAPAPAPPPAVPAAPVAVRAGRTSVRVSAAAAPDAAVVGPRVVPPAALGGFRIRETMEP